MQQCDRIVPDWCACGICSSDHQDKSTEIYITYDDIWKANKLEEQLNFMKQNNYAFSYTAFKYMNNEGTRAGKKINIVPKLSIKNAFLTSQKASE